MPVFGGKKMNVMKLTDIAYLVDVVVEDTQACKDLERKMRHVQYQDTNSMHEFLFYNKFIILLYMFRALLC